jgi:hypothetical protein
MFYDSCKRERVKLIKVVHRNKLGKKISDEILMPILNQLEEDYSIILENIAEWAKERIQNYLRDSSPSGRTYKIYHYDPSMPWGHRTILIDEYTASAPYDVPAQKTGTLVESIEYRINSDGSFHIGLLKDKGIFSEMQTEFESVFYRSGKIFVNPNLEASTKTPVGTYGDYLATGTPNMAERSFFQRSMNEIRNELREKIRKNIRTSLNKITRRISVRRAVIFKVYYRS